MKLKAFLFAALIGIGFNSYAGTTIGAHIASVHSSGDFNNVNPGIYIKHDGYTVGTYYNSERRQSFYAGYTLEGELYSRVNWGVTVGAITGYASHSVLPLVAPSISFPLINDIKLRLFYLPKVEKTGAHVLHMSIEKEF